ncbi:MAG: hypothetical protein AB1405_12820, partial [Bdellovibrionota bacterium]
GLARRPPFHPSSGASRHLPPAGEGTGGRRLNCKMIIMITFPSAQAARTDLDEDGRRFKKR